jgi:hypothetical protein
MPSSLPMHIASISLALAIASAGCAGGAAAPRPPSTGLAPATTDALASSRAADPPIAAPIAAPGPGEWAAWSHEQKRAYMKTTVLAAERAVFARFEPVRFRKLDCRTCHGRGAVDGNFKMPNPDLPKLVGGAEGFGELAANEPRLLQFMQSVVVPETAKLLGVPAFDMKSHTGFSCFHCHTRSDRE